jgi:hypothetical protein
VKTTSATVAAPVATANKSTVKAPAKPSPAPATPASKPASVFSVVPIVNTEINGILAAPALQPAAKKKKHRVFDD